MTEADSCQLEHEARISNALLSATGLTRIYRQGDQSVPALRGVDLDLGVGEFVAIVGRSGSGKSSLLHIVSGLDRPDDGAVLLEGRRISSLPEPELAVVRRQRFGFVLQFYNLLPTLNALENVAFPLMLDSVPDALDRASAFLDRVGLKSRAGHRPNQLSGGQATPSQKHFVATGGAPIKANQERTRDGYRSALPTIRPEVLREGDDIGVARGPVGHQLQGAPAREREDPIREQRRFDVGGAHQHPAPRV